MPTIINTNNQHLTEKIHYQLKTTSVINAENKDNLQRLPNTFLKTKKIQSDRWKLAKRRIEQLHE